MEIMWSAGFRLGELCACQNWPSFPTYTPISVVWTRGSRGQRAGGVHDAAELRAEAARLAHALQRLRHSPPQTEHAPSRANPLNHAPGGNAMAGILKVAESAFKNAGDSAAKTGPSMLVVENFASGNQEVGSTVSPAESNSSLCGHPFRRVAQLRLEEF